MKYENLFLDQERALYGIRDSEVAGCSFAGPADGESALKECRNLDVRECFFDLRYPLWHLECGRLSHVKMTENCRAALWYDIGLTVEDSELRGIKAVRECRDTTVRRSKIDSPEFGWFCKGLKLRNVKLVSEYPFLKSENLDVRALNMKGKYSFQYVKDAVLRDCVLDTKDAFWHAENVRVENCVVKGEYLGWYSKNLTFVNCRIEGTQPLCYAEGLVLENCETANADLAFENSDVRASLRGCLLSVKNPKSGRIEADGIGKVILDEYCLSPRSCEIRDRGCCAERSA